VTGIIQAGKLWTFEKFNLRKPFQFVRMDLISYSINQRHFYFDAFLYIIELPRATDSTRFINWNNELSGID
jgi:hypothetical protein